MKKQEAKEIYSTLPVFVYRVLLFRFKKIEDLVINSLTVVVIIKLKEIIRSGCQESVQEFVGVSGYTAH